MAYTKNPQWKDYPDESTPVTAERLNHLEDGVEAAAETADSAVAGLSGKADTGHTHTAGDVSGLATVATSGSYDDLDDKPSIPSTPGDIGAAAASHSHTADHISDATNVGKGVLTAADAAAARSAIGAGTSSLSIGTTDSTAAAGNRGLPAGGTEGQVLAKASGSNYDTEWVDPPEGGGGGGVAPHAMTGRWHQGMVKGNIGNSNVSITGGTLYCLPAWSDGETIDAVWIRISTDSPSVTVRLGFYAVRADGRPGDLIADLGTINGASGVRTVMVNPALTLPRGPHFRVLVADNAETFNVYGMSSSGIVDPRNWLGAQNGDQSPNTAGGVTYTGYDPTAPLPSSATTAGESFLAHNHVPAITVRAA